MKYFIHCSHFRTNKRLVAMNFQEYLSIRQCYQRNKPWNQLDFHAKFRVFWHHSSLLCFFFSTFNNLMRSTHMKPNQIHPDLFNAKCLSKEFTGRFSVPFNELKRPTTLLLIGTIPCYWLLRFLPLFWLTLAL